MTLNILLVTLWFFLKLSFGTRPNIIFFITDDMGWNDIGSQSNNQILTPAIDFLREEGQYLDWFYAQPACSPTRASLMTGRYPIHHGVYSPQDVGGAAGLPLEFELFPEILNEYGWATHMIGKWHLGFYKWSYTPTFRGFDSFYGYYRGFQDYYTHIGGNYYDFFDAIGQNCGQDCTRTASEAYGIYNTYLFTDRAVSIIETHDKTQPLFLYVSYESVHSPTQVPQQYVDKYEFTIEDETRRIYAGMLTAMDESIGHITDCLNENGYLDPETGNTIIIFVSDNGGPINSQSGYSTGASNWALRGGKGSTWEGGMRVNGILYGTEDVISRNKVGTTYTQLMHMVDFFPTLLTAAGIDYTQHIKNDVPFDGIDHWEGLSKDYNPIDQYFHYRDNLYYTPTTPFVNAGFRERWYKLYNGTGGNPDAYCCDQNIGATQIGFKTKGQNFSMQLNESVMDIGPFALFQLEEDPYEYWNITDEHLERVAFLFNRMRVLEETAVPVIQPDPTCGDATHPIDPDLDIGIWEPWCGQ
eukprot:19555_1